MIDIELIRSNPGAMRANLEKRGDTEKSSWLEELVEKDKLWRQLKQEEDVLRNKRNILTEQIKNAKKANQDISQLLLEAQGIPKKIDENNIPHDFYYLDELPKLRLPSHLQSRVIEKHRVECPFVMRRLYEE